MRVVFLALVALVALASTENAAATLPDVPPTAPEVSLVTAAQESYAQARERAAMLLQENAGNPAACEAIAEDEIKTVKSVCTGAQAILNQVNRGQLCAKLATASSGLHTFQPDIDKAQAKVDAAKSELSAARSATVTYSVGFEALAPGKCEAIFGSQSYLEAKAKVDSARKKVAKAEGELAGFKKIAAGAKAKARQLEVKCLKEARKGMKKALKVAQETCTSPEQIKAFTRAQHMKCVLKKIPLQDCKVPTLPTIHVPCLADFVHGGSFDDFKWDPASTAWKISTDGKFATQSGGWTGVSAKEPVCTKDEKGKHRWYIQIRKGTYHQIGISKGAKHWNGRNPVSHQSSTNSPFAFLYSHHDGWNRHRGAAKPAKWLNNGHCSRQVCWSGTWDQWQKGAEFRVDLDCDTRHFSVTTQQGAMLASMTYPSSWDNIDIFPAFGGQSSDHQVSIYAERQYKFDKDLETFQWDPSKVSGSVISDGKTWKQQHGWSGVVAKKSYCENDSESTHSWGLRIDQGTYHQVGIANEKWKGNHGSTSHSHYNNDFAFVYSHSTGWNRHRGAARPDSSNPGGVYHPCPECGAFWPGTWDRHNLGAKKMYVKLDCKKKTFTVSTSQQTLATMSYPKTWKKVFPAMGGQSSDHKVTIMDPPLPPQAAPADSGTFGDFEFKIVREPNPKWHKSGEYAVELCKKVGMKPICDSSACEHSTKSIAIGKYGGNSHGDYKWSNAGSGTGLKKHKTGLYGGYHDDWFPKGFEAVFWKFNRLNLCYYYADGATRPTICSMAQPQWPGGDRCWNAEHTWAKRKQNRPLLKGGPMVNAPGALPWQDWEWGKDGQDGGYDMKKWRSVACARKKTEEFVEQVSDEELLDDSN
jgi:hypothetical protein